MTEAEICARIRDRLSRLFGGAAVQDDDDIFRLGLLTSLYALRLVQAIEREFELVVSDDDLKLANFRSVSAMAQLVKRALEER